MDIKDTEIYTHYSDMVSKLDILDVKYRNKEITKEEYNKLCDLEWDKFLKYPEYSEEEQKINIHEIIKIYNKEQEKMINELLIKYGYDRSKSTSFSDKLFATNTDLRFLFITGFCGGYTTFSTFGFENIQLIQNNQLGLAFTYIGLSVLIGLLAVWFGLFLAK